MWTEQETGILANKTPIKNVDLSHKSRVRGQRLATPKQVRNNILSSIQM